MRTFFYKDLKYFSILFNAALDEIDGIHSASVAMETQLLGADWLQELPEDLDMCIAQRDFEGAVDLVERGKISTWNL